MAFFWRGHAKIFDIERVNMPDVEVVEEKCMNSEKSFRGHTDLNHGPIELQPIALPLSYIPKTNAGGLKCSDAHGR